MARRYYVEMGGRRVFVPTLADAKATAQAVADRFRQVVHIGFVNSRPKAKTMRRNPVMAGVNYTGELWKISFAGPHGQRGHMYANTQREAEGESRILRARGYRPTAVVRLQAPMDDAPKARRRRRA